ncbi:hypothetical protein V8C86DRAFT_2490386, partial [Haematococcus lacustris]
LLGELSWCICATSGATWAATLCAYCEAMRLVCAGRLLGEEALLPCCICALPQAKPGLQVSVCVCHAAMLLECSGRLLGWVALLPCCICMLPQAEPGL